MLDYQSTGPKNEKQTRTTQVRHGNDLAELLERATALLGVEKSEFIRNAIAREAQRVIKANSHHVLTGEDARQFSAALDKPPSPTPRATKAANAYRRRVINAD